jgi:phosphoglycerate dehydrogenase-like enzyme
VVVVTAAASDPPPEIEGIAREVELRFAPDAATLARHLPDADVVFAWWARREDLEAAWPSATRLRWIQAGSVGVNTILFPALVESEVILTNVRGAAEGPIAESVLGFIVAMAKGFRRIVDDQRRHVWAQELTTEPVAGRRLLVVGPGPIGRAIGRAAREGLGMRVEAVGRTARPGDDVFDAIGGTDDLHGALGEADYVVDAMPLTTETHRLFDRSAFAAMKPTARFVNIGRGATVDERALVEALASERIAGAALDVFEEEPLPADSPLWDMENVIVCPHRSGNIDGWQASFAAVFYENLARWLRGEPLRNVVDKRLGFPASG